MTDSPFGGSRTLLVIPTYNERENIERLVTSIRSYVPDLTIWIVDDNSPDGTGRVADGLAASQDRLEVFHRPGKLGLGTAYIQAFQQALSDGYDIVIQMDADFSHDPRYLPVMLNAIHEVDLVVGSRYTEGGGTKNWSLVRRMISRGGNLVARLGLGLKTRDVTGGFRVYSRSTLEQLHFDDLRLTGYGFQIEVMFQIEHRGLRVREIPIVFVERLSGSSKMSIAIALEAFLHIVRRRIGMIRGIPEPEPDMDRALVSVENASSSVFPRSLEQNADN